MGKCPSVQGVSVCFRSVRGWKRFRRVFYKGKKGVFLTCREFAVSLCMCVVEAEMENKRS